MSNVTMRGKAVRRAPKRARISRSPGEPTAAQVFYMPTVEEVTAAGYPADRMDDIRHDVAELRVRFDSDPDFRKRALERYAERRARGER